LFKIEIGRSLDVRTWTFEFDAGVAMFAVALGTIS